MPRQRHFLNTVLGLIFVVVGLSFSTAFGATTAAAVVPATKAAPVKQLVVAPAPTASSNQPLKGKDEKALKALRKMFQNADSVSMDLTKVIKQDLLKQERRTSGHLLVSKGRLRMTIDPPEQSLMVVDKRNIWIVNYPAPEFKDAALQVIKASAETKKGRSQSLIGLLARGNLLKYFSVVNVRSEANGDKVFFLQPLAHSVEFTRAQVTLSPEENLKALHFWDEIGNETDYEFSKIVVGAKVSDKDFKYTPPANADVTVY
jgi:outer membrane lipoprotein carrier protein